MQPGGVIAGAHVQRLPCVCIQIIDGMILFAGKAEQPVPSRKGGNVCLIHSADGESGRNALVAALHGAGILGIEGAALLVHHDAVRFQGIEAAAVELAGEQTLAPMLKPFLPQPDNKAKQNANKTILLFIPSLYSIFNDVHFVAKWFIVITLSGIGEN